MAQWIGIGLTALGLILTAWRFSVYMAGQWAKFNERQDYMKGEIIALQNASQTPGEREALAEILETRFAAHEEKDDLRFDSMSREIAEKLDLILKAVNAKARSGH